MIDWDSFSTKKFENYRYEISKLKNQGNLNNIDSKILSKGEKYIDYHKQLTRLYYFLEFIYLIKKYRYLDNLKFAFAFFRMTFVTFSLNYVLNKYLDKNISKYLHMSKIEQNKMSQFESFISHKNN